jgi:hypothetical protein
VQNLWSSLTAVGVEVAGDDTSCQEAASNPNNHVPANEMNAGWGGEDGATFSLTTPPVGNTNCGGSTANLQAQSVSIAAADGSSGYLYDAGARAMYVCGTRHGDYFNIGVTPQQAADYSGVQGPFLAFVNAALTTTLP